MEIYLIVAFDAHSFCISTPKAFVCVETARNWLRTQTSDKCHYQLQKIYLETKSEANIN